MNIIENQITAVLILTIIILLYVVGKDFLKFLKTKIYFKFLSYRLRRMIRSTDDQETKEALNKAADLANEISKEEKFIDINGKEK